MKASQADSLASFSISTAARRSCCCQTPGMSSSARIFEDAGFPAIATTSAGIANSLGYPDGQKLPRGEMIAVVRRIVESVKVPVTADMMAGYGATPDEVANTVSEVLSCGAVGMNLEDGVDGQPGVLADLNLQKEIVRAAIEASEHAEVPFVLNARTDVFLHAVGPAETRLARTVERLNAYRDSGAQSLGRIDPVAKLSANVCYLLHSRRLGST